MVAQAQQLNNHCTTTQRVHKRAAQASNEPVSLIPPETLQIGIKKQKQHNFILNKPKVNIVEDVIIGVQHRLRSVLAYGEFKKSIQKAMRTHFGDFFKFLKGVIHCAISHPWVYSATLNSKNSLH